VIAQNGHLGGYAIGGDHATFYPELWAWLVERLAIRTVLDVGCGEGHSVDAFARLGCEVVGLDGVPQPHPAVVTHDFTTGPAPIGGDYDLVWCCEFVEHVDERYLPNFLAAFARGRYVFLTHAEPGQPGYHHVNCRPTDYWRGAMAAIGYAVDERLTVAARAVAGENRSAWNHFVRAGYAFARPQDIQPDSNWVWETSPSGVR